MLTEEDDICDSCKKPLRGVLVWVYDIQGDEYCYHYDCYDETRDDFRFITHTVEGLK